MEIDLQQLPIPDWGMTCPHCQYPLRGLPEHRCPECGLALVMEDLVKPWTRLRAPHFTGAERPLPDFGLRCQHCGAPLAGAEGAVCAVCGAQFDLAALRPRGDWFVLDSGLARELPIPGLQALLANELVPHFQVNEQGLQEIYGGQSMTVTRLRVPTEFYFDVLWLIARARRSVQAIRSGHVGPPWACSVCGEENPGNFDMCWSCQQERR